MNIKEPTTEMEQDWAAWVAERPPTVRAVAERIRPWTLYRMKSSGHRVTVFSFDESEAGVTLKVVVSAKYNLIAFERLVFGIDPDDLEDCELPGPGEPVGAHMTQEEARAMFARKAAN